MNSVTHTNNNGIGMRLIHKVSFPGADYKKQNTISWTYLLQQILNTHVVEVCRLGLESLCNNHLCLPVILKMLTLTGQEFLKV
jgi:hypothetical protein